MAPDPVPVDVEIGFQEDFSEITEADVKRFIRDLEKHLPELMRHCSMEIMFTGDDQIRQLNARYRNMDRPTDVLSFPDGETDPESGRRFLGSIVVSVERARAQAADIGHDVATELCFLVLHGILHLLGYDHETDDGAMLNLQRSLQFAMNMKTGGEPVS